LIVRQAIHRLEELELVRVRQGSTTVVLDPNEASDVRLIQLQLEVAQPGDALALAGIENRSAMTLPLLVLAERRITAREVRELEVLVDGLSPTPTQKELVEFAAQFWAKVAAATRNPLLRHQVRWWFRVSETFRPTTENSRPPMSPAIYRCLVDALRDHSGVADVWIKVVNGVCDWTESQPGHTAASERPARAAAPKRGAGRTGTRARPAAARSAAKPRAK
jgi:DNA-binding FadR family transcriptional regulator